MDILPGMNEFEKGMHAMYDVYTRTKNLEALSSVADFVVTNNPLPNALLAVPETVNFEAYLLELFASFRNINIFVRGRGDEDLSNGSADIRHILVSRNIPCVEFAAGFPDPMIKAPERLFNLVLALKNEIFESGLHRDELSKPHGVPVSYMPGLASNEHSEETTRERTIIPFRQPASRNVPETCPTFRLARVEN